VVAVVCDRGGKVRGHGQAAAAARVGQAAVGGAMGASGNSRNGGGGSEAVGNLRGLAAFEPGL
jgi:hypothetical protein